MNTADNPETGEENEAEAVSPAVPDAELPEPPAEPDDAPPSPESTRLMDAPAPDMAAAEERTVIDTDPPATSASQATVIGNVALAPLGSKDKARLVEPGTLINNNYRIEALISAGGMGEVYRAVNVFTDDPVAVKVILPDLARDQDIINLFLHEARILVQLRDDAIVSYHNFILDQGLDRYCLIMEFVEGTHLGTRIGDRQPMHPDETIRLMQRLARGLGQAHQRGVTHRDLSPDNVILRHDQIDEAVLIDFGIARSIELGDGLAGRFAGKFKYIAPEQLGHFDGRIGPQTDIYGLALLITALQRGEALDMGDSVVTASDARRVIPDLTGVSHRLFPLLQYMLEPDPADRPADMGQIIAMLSDPMLIPARYRLPLWQGTGTGVDHGDETTGVSESPFGAPQPPHDPHAAIPQPAAPAAAKRRSMAAVAAAGSLVLVLTAIAGWYALRGQHDPAPPPEQTASPAADPAAALPPRDLASREGFLADHDLGPCALAQRITSGPEAGMIEITAAKNLDTAPLQDAYAEAFSTRPNILQRRIRAAQCPALDFTAALAGRQAPAPLIAANTRADGSGFQLEAEVSGITQRNPWLVLISPDGAVYDLTGQSQPDGEDARHIGAAINLPGGAQPGADPYLLLAVTSSAPLVSVAAAPMGANASTILPGVLAELQSDGGGAAAGIVVLNPSPAPAETSPEEQPADPG
ncbi:MAG: protein kinase domain-containing protein [Paracoccus sp. (in: a-proteobacteria)]